MSRVFWSIILTALLALPAVAAEPAPVVPPVPPKPSAGITLPKSLEVIVGRARGNVLAADTQGKEVVFTVGFGVDTPDLLPRDATSCWVIAPVAGWYYIFASTSVDGHPVVSDGCLVKAVLVPTPPAPPPEPPKPPTPPVPQPPTPGPGPSPIPPIPQPPAPPVPPTPPTPPKPPEPPAPTDPLTMALQAAYTADADTAGKARSLDFLTKAYVAMPTAIPAGLKTNGDALAWIKSVVGAPTVGLSATQLVGVRKLLAQDMATAMGTVATATLDLPKFTAELTKVGKALQGVH